MRRSAAASGARSERPQSRRTRASSLTPARVGLRADRPANLPPPFICGELSSDADVLPTAFVTKHGNQDRHSLGAGAERGAVKERRPTRLSLGVALANAPVDAVLRGAEQGCVTASPGQPRAGET